jgi:hypothetical protein
MRYLSRCVSDAQALHDRIEALEKALSSASGSAHPLLQAANHLDEGAERSGKASPNLVPTSSHEGGPPSSRSRRAAEADEPEGSDRSEDTEGTSGLGHLRIDPSRPGASRFYGDASSLFLIVSRVGSVL